MAKCYFNAYTRVDGHSEVLQGVCNNRKDAVNALMEVFLSDNKDEITWRQLTEIKDKLTTFDGYKKYNKNYYIRERELKEVRYTYNVWISGKKENRDNPIYLTQRDCFNAMLKDMMNRFYNYSDLYQCVYNHSYKAFDSEQLFVSKKGIEIKTSIFPHQILVDRMYNFGEGIEPDTCEFLIKEVELK